MARWAGKRAARGSKRKLSALRGPFSKGTKHRLGPARRQVGKQVKEHKCAGTGAA